MRTASIAIVLSLSVASCAPESAVTPQPKAAPDIITMGLDAQKNAGLVVTPVVMVPMTEYLHATGTVQPMDSRRADVRPLARGRVQDVLVRVGDRVTSGQPLARIDVIEAGELSSQVLVARAELQRLKVQQANAARQLERSKGLVEIGVVAQKEFELLQAESAAMAEAVRAQESVLGGLDAKLRRFGISEAQLQASTVTTIVAPFAGTVIRVEAAPGEVVEQDMALFAVTDLADVWVQAEVYERDLGRIKVGQPARISVDTYPDVVFTGHVAHISDTLDPNTRTAQVRCVVPNPDRRLKVDMLASVDVPVSLSRQVLAVPAAAVQQVEGKNVLFVRRADDAFQMREVTLGATSGGQVEIVSGLTENDPVVTVGAYHLKSIRMIAEFGEEG